MSEQQQSQQRSQQRGRTTIGDAAVSKIAGVAAQEAKGASGNRLLGDVIDYQA